MRRPVSPPPEPVDVENVKWQSRAWQWLFDTVVHMHECMDAVKDAQTEFQAEVNARITAATDTDGTLRDQIRAHQEFHNTMEAVAKAEQAQRNRWLSPFKKLIDEAPKLLVALTVLVSGGVGAVIGVLFG